MKIIKNTLKNTKGFLRDKHDGSLCIKIQKRYWFVKYTKYIHKT